MPKRTDAVVPCWGRDTARYRFSSSLFVGRKPLYCWLVLPSVFVCLKGHGTGTVIVQFTNSLFGWLEVRDVY